jgi:hypothetical protein
MTRLLVVVTVLLVAASVQAVDITQCRQIVPLGETGELTADLDCPTGPSTCQSDPAIECGEHLPCPNDDCLSAHAVVLEDGATLKLNGLTITGGFNGVYCRGSTCTVLGP